MTIEQKAREIAVVVWNRTADEINQWASISGFEQEEFTRHVKAGVIDGQEMAAKWHDEQAKIYDNYADQEWDDRAAEKVYRQRANQHRVYAKTIRALSEEQKP